MQVIVNGKEKNYQPKLHKIIHATSLNNDITNFTIENVYELCLTEEILEETEAIRFDKNDQSFTDISVEEIKVYFALNDMDISSPKIHPRYKVTGARTTVHQISDVLK